MKKKFRRSLKKDYRNFAMLIIILACSILVILSMPVHADDEDEIEDSIIQENDINEENIMLTSSAQKNSNEGTVQEKKVAKPILNSRRYIVFDRTSGMEVYGKDYNKETAMASTTKIMTAIIVLENCDNLNEEVTIEEKAALTGGSRLGLKKGDKITVNDLLYGLLMRSGNDAAIALAIYIAGSKEDFADLMNDKANSLGLKNTHFVTPHGLDDPKHYTTALELAKLTDYALKNKKFAEIVKTQYASIKINGNEKELKNTNELLLANIEGVYGVKTGFTNNAGRCLVTAVKRNNMDLIIVVLGADTRKDRAKDTIKLIEYVTNNFKVENITNYVQEEFEIWKNINEKRIYINKSNSNLVTEISQANIESVITDEKISVETTSIAYLEAPVKKGTRIGTITIKKGKEIIEELPILAKYDVYKKNIFDYFYIFGKVFMN